MNDDELVVVGSFANPVAASLAHDRLQDEGVRAFVMDSEVAAMAWYLTNAIGGIKLYVAQRDLVRAQVILDELEKHVQGEMSEGETDLEDPPPSDAIQQGDPDSIRPGHPFPEGPDDDPEDAPTERELDAKRAYMGAVAGLIVLPIQIFVTFLIFAVLGSEERLRMEYRRKLQWAMAINFPLMLIALVFAAMLAKRVLLDG